MIKFLNQCRLLISWNFSESLTFGHRNVDWLKPSSYSKGQTLKVVIIIVIALISTLMPCFVANAEGPLTRHIVVLDWTPNTNHTGLYVAQAKGYYEDEGLDISLVQPPEDDSALMVAASRASFGVSFQEALGPALAGKPPLPITVIAAIIQHNHSGLVSLKSSNINRPAQLEGKKLATWGAPLFDAVVSDIVSRDGGDYSKVKLVYNNVTDVVSALKTSVDAVWVFQGWDGLALKEAGLDCNYFSLKDLNPIFDFYTPVLFANNSLIEKDPEAVKAFLRASAKGYEFAAKNPDAAAEILLRAAPELNENLVKNSQRFLANLYIDDAPKWGLIDKNRWNAFYAWMYEKNLLATDLASQENSGFTNDFLPLK